MNKIGGKWKNVFMENDISRDENRFSVEIIQLVTFNSIRVANKDTRYSLGIKFVPSSS
jgi:hypothetical protein